MEGDGASADAGGRSSCGRAQGCSSKGWQIEVAVGEGVRRVLGGSDCEVGGSQRWRRGDSVAGVVAVRQAAREWSVLVCPSGAWRAGLDEAARGAVVEPNPKAGQGKGVDGYGARDECSVAVE
eukprot:2294869-Prymnesium_polylepis.1